MKKLLTVFLSALTAISCFALVGCGEDNGKNSKPAKDTGVITEAQFNAVFDVSSAIVDGLIDEDVDYKADITRTDVRNSGEDNEETNVSYASVVKDGYKFERKELNKNGEIFNAYYTTYAVVSKDGDGKYSYNSYDENGRPSGGSDERKYPAQMLFANMFNVSIIERGIDYLIGELVLETDADFNFSEFEYNTVKGEYSLKSPKTINAPSGEEYCVWNKVDVKFLNGKIVALDVIQTETESGEQAIVSATVTKNGNRETLIAETAISGERNGEEYAYNVKMVAETTYDAAGRMTSSVEKIYYLAPATEEGDSEAEREYVLNYEMTVSAEYLSDGKTASLERVYSDPEYNSRSTLTITFDYGDKTVDIPEYLPEE